MVYSVLKKKRISISIFYFEFLLNVYSVRIQSEIYLFPKLKFLTTVKLV